MISNVYMNGKTTATINGRRPIVVVVCLYTYYVYYYYFIIILKKHGKHESRPREM